MEILPLSDQHRADLHQRGIDDDQVDLRQYRTVGKMIGVKATASLVEEFVADTLLRVPGFGKDESGDVMLCAYSQGILIPVRDLQGRIVALKVRLDSPNGGGKYRYLSGRKCGGVSPGAPCHVPLGTEASDVVRVTEGELKADVAQIKDPTVATTSIAGVSTWRKALPVVKAFKSKEVRVAFDSDAATNDAVRISRAALCRELVRLGCDVQIESWNSRFKGIDDALVAGVEIEVEPFVDREPEVETTSRQNETDVAPDNLLQKYGRPILEIDGRTTLNQMYFAGRYVAETAILHDPSIRRFFIYEDPTGLWRHQTNEATMCELGDLFQRVVIEFKQPHLLGKRTSPFLAGLREMTRGIAEKRGVFDERPEAIHVGNGMLQLFEDGGVSLLPCSPNYYSRNRSEIEWNPRANCPRFKRELLEFALPPEDVSLIQRYGGQCLLGRNPSQKILLLRGMAGGGKSSLVNVLELVLGKHNSTELRVAHLAERFELVRYIGKTILTGKDVPGDFLNRRSVSILKALVGKDTVHGEVKGGNESFSLVGDFNVIVTSNTRLRVHLDSDAGAWRRRLMIVDYERPAPEKPIEDFDEILVREEGPGILRWLVEGAIQLKSELREHGRIVLTEEQKKRVDDLLAESDSVRAFVQNCVIADAGAELPIAVLTTAYRDFAESRGWEPMKELQFQRALPDAMLEFHRAIKRNDIQHGGRSGRGFKGVRLVPKYTQAGDFTTQTDCFSEFSDGSDGYFKVLREGANQCEEHTTLIRTLEKASEPSETPPLDETTEMGGDFYEVQW